MSKGLADFSCRIFCRKPQLCSLELSHSENRYNRAVCEDIRIIRRLPILSFTDVKLKEAEVYSCRVGNTMGHKLNLNGCNSRQISGKILCIRVHWVFVTSIKRRSFHKVRFVISMTIHYQLGHTTTTLPGFKLVSSQVNWRGMKCSTIYEMATSPLF